MKLYDCGPAPNPRRVRVFLAEKGVEIPSVQVDLAKAEHKQPEFLAKNSMGAVPVLELDDGSYLSETVAICRYIEGLHPEPCLMGGDARSAAEIEMWQRRIEFALLLSVAQAFRNTSDFFKGRVPQVAEYGEVSRKAALKNLEWLDRELSGREFIAGDAYSIADITALCAIDFGGAAGISVDPKLEQVTRWYESVSSRPSASA